MWTQFERFSKLVNSLILGERIVTAVGINLEGSALCEFFWWQSAVVYQVYLRSFRDGNGDGVGDLPGLTAGLEEIAALGTDAIWLNPCYLSPQRDHGYDIEDFRVIDPAYGTMSDFDAMLAHAHELGLKVLMDMVANHASDQHDWFRAALASEPGSVERERFLFRDGRGANGDLPPNNWQSVFGGPAWTREPHGTGPHGQWYLHSFDPGQPDFNWRSPEVSAYFEGVLRFWFDHGVDGFRIDVAHGLVKAPGLPDQSVDSDGYNAAMWDQPEVHDIYRTWRQIADSYDEPKYFVGEIWVPSPDRLVNYLRPDELHQAFSFDLLVQPWNASSLRSAIDKGLTAAGGSPAWTLSNHDVHRTVTRYGQQQVFDEPDATDMIAAARRRGPVDVDLGVRRARAAAALLLALPGTVYLYQGEELGLPEVLDLPPEARRDPIWVRSSGLEHGRDGCRVPLPWSASAESFGFSPSGAGEPTWLPQPDWFARFARDCQHDDPRSTLTLYRALITVRKSLFDPVSPLTWLNAGTDVLALMRGDALCIVNLRTSAYRMPAAWDDYDVVLATEPQPTDREVPPDTAVWLNRTSPSTAQDAQASPSQSKE